MTTIDPKLAMQLRQRGLMLPATGQFSDPRLAAIAKRQQVLMDEMDRLDREIESMLSWTKQTMKQAKTVYEAPDGTTMRVKEQPDGTFYAECDKYDRVFSDRESLNKHLRERRYTPAGIDLD